MSDYKGDFAEDATVTFFFNTVDTGGDPITIGGTAAVEVYKDGGLTQSSAGVTVTEDFGSITGLHKVVVDMSADAFYAAGADYSAVISVGTADSVSVVGSTVAEWSCENRWNEVNVVQWLGTAPATPTTAGVPEVDATYWRGQLVPATNTTGVPVVDTSYFGADAVTKTGGLISANVTQISGDATAANNLESYCDGTTPIPANVTTWLGTAAATPTVAGVPEVDITHVGGVAASTAGSVDVSTTSVNAIADQVLDEALSGHVTAGTLGKAIADIETDATAILEDTATTIPGTIATVDGNVDAILVDTGTTIPAQITALNDPTAGAIADAVWDEAIAAHQGAGSTGLSLQTAEDQATGANLRLTNSGSPSAAEISTQIQTDLATEIGRIDQAVSAAGSLTTGERDAVAAAILDLANGVETSWTLRQAMRIVLSATAAKVSGMDDNAPVFRDVGDTKSRITATTDANGNRSAVTLDAT